MDYRRRTMRCGFADTKLRRIWAKPMLIWLILMILVLIIQFNNINIHRHRFQRILDDRMNHCHLALTWYDLTFLADDRIFWVMGVWVESSIDPYRRFQIFTIRKNDFPSSIVSSKSIAERFIPIFWRNWLRSFDCSSLPWKTNYSDLWR